MPPPAEIDLRLERHVVPIHEKRALGSRHTLYPLTDNYVAVCYRHIDRLRHPLGARRNDGALARIQDNFNAYVPAHVFEDVCWTYVWRAVAVGCVPTSLEFDVVGGR